MLAPPKGPVLAALLATLLYVIWACTLPTTQTYGWDETMHAQLPAARIVVATLDTNFTAAARTVLGCQQYPPGYPLALAASQLIFGISEHAARLTTLATWALTLFGLFLLGQELASARRSDLGHPGRNDTLLPWLLMGFGALSPLALHYAGTLFLEVPFTFCLVFTLRAWLRRGHRATNRNLAWRELIAGLWLTAAFFTKFNYGVLLAFGLGLDALCELVTEYRAGRLSEYLRRLAFLGAIPLLSLLWWFALPLPEGLDTAAAHRSAFLAFLSGNQEMAPTPWQQRALYWTSYLTISFRLFVLLSIGLLVSLRCTLQPGVRLLWLVFLGAGIPVWTHNFHLDRFLIPGAPAFWALAALGLTQLLPSSPRPRALALASLAGLTLVLPSFDAPRVADALGILSKKPEVLAIQERALARWSNLGSDRPLPSAGTTRALYESLLALATQEATPEERIGWLGISTELSPGALHLSLLAAGGSRSRFLRDSIQPMDVTFAASDPGWSDEELRHFARGFDVIFCTDPPDLAGRAGRAFIRDYSQRIVERLGWSAQELGEVMRTEDSGAESAVRLYALRPPR